MGFGRARSFLVISTHRCSTSVRWYLMHRPGHGCYVPKTSQIVFCFVLICRHMRLLKKWSSGPGKAIGRVRGFDTSRFALRLVPPLQALLVGPGGFDSA